MYVLISLVVIVIILRVISIKDRLSKSQAKVLLNENAVIVDVRTKTEYKSSHITGSINIPHTEIAKGIKKNKIKKERPIILYCASGARSSAAIKILKNAGYERLYNGGSLFHMEKIING